jgi:AraC family transcriptional regulator
MLDVVERKPEFFDGRVLRWSNVAELMLGEIVYPSAYERASHTHQRACFHFIFQGGYVEQQGTRTQECKTSTLVFQPRGYEHAYRASKAISRAFTIEFEDAWLARLNDHGMTLDSPGNFDGGMAAWLLARLYNEFCVMETGSSLVIEALALELAVEVARRKETTSGTRPPLWLKQAIDLLHARFAEPLSLQTIAQSVGVHPVHLARVFREHHRCTVGEYIRRLRIEFACQQLVFSRASLLEIALAAGFSDQSQFSHTFKRATGLTPGKFRAEAQPR